MSNMRQEIIQLCVDLGKNPLMVQGAGGNVSWKDGEVLWVKGSGAWLASADRDDIFVPVDLTDLKEALSNEKFDFKPKVIGKHYYRSSIETMLHALMPTNIVVHLHAVEALTHLVIRDSRDSINRLIRKPCLNEARSAFVEYYKPGPELAKAVYQTLQSNPTSNIIFLKNHGVVVGANTNDEIRELLKNISSIFKPKNMPHQHALLRSLPSINCGFEAYYNPFFDVEVQNLALDPTLYKRLHSDWVLYPDHAVFLGSIASTFSSWIDFESKKYSLTDLPTLIFIENTGVFIRPDFNMSQAAQLRCYYDVISRIDSNIILDPLSESAISDLLDWDAEKYRVNLAK